MNGPQGTLTEVRATFGQQTLTFDGLIPINGSSDINVTIDSWTLIDQGPFFLPAFGLVATMSNAEFNFNGTAQITATDANLFNGVHAWNLVNPQGTIDYETNMIGGGTVS